MSIIPRLSPPSTAPITDPFVITPLWDGADYTVAADQTVYADGNGGDGGGAGFLVDAMYPFAGTFTNDGVAWVRGNGAYLFSALYAGDIVNNGIAVAESTSTAQAQTYSIGGLFTSLTNTGGIYAYGDDAPAFAIWEYGGFIAPIVNSGTIAALGDEAEGQAVAILRENGGQIENLAGGSILAESAYAVAIETWAGRNGNPGDPAEIINHGRIEAHSTLAGSLSIAIAGMHSAPTTMNVDNWGLIKGDYAIRFDHYPLDNLSNVSETITNFDSGTIEGIIALINGDDRVLNDGAIVGDILLGNGNDLYDGADGTLDGIAHGERGNDHLISGAGDDILDGGVGNDAIEGGGGIDTALFSRDRGVYTVSVTGDVATIVSAADGTDTITGVERFVFADGTYSLAELIASPAPDLSQYLLCAPDGMMATVGRTGSVLGTAGGQDVTVLDLPGRITFDPSFNGGGDRIHLAGDASAYTVARDGSMLVLSDGDTSIAVPAGVHGADIVFDDGSRTITVDIANNAILLGGQAVTAAEAAIVVPPETPGATGDLDPTAEGLLVMAPDSIATFGGAALVFGSPNASESLAVLAGSNIRLDPSFNQGGDTIMLPGAPEDYEAVRSGSTAVLTSDDLGITLPIGTEPTTVSFGDVARDLFYDAENENVQLGDQVLYDFPTPVAPLDDGTPIL